MRTALPVLGLLLAGSALAEPDTFALGTGRTGSLRMDSGTQVVNRSAALTASVTVGTRELTVSDSTGFAVGDLVLLHPSIGLSPAPESGDPRRLSLDSSTVGRFEYARLEEVAAGTLRLTAPLRYGFPASMTQVVRVPEYTELEVRSGATLRAAPWDGRVGGIFSGCRSLQREHRARGGLGADLAECLPASGGCLGGLWVGLGLIRRRRGPG